MNCFRNVLNYLKVKMYNINVRILGVESFQFVPEQFKTQEMCEFAVEKNAGFLFYVPEQFKT